MKKYLIDDNNIKLPQPYSLKSDIIINEKTIPIIITNATLEMNNSSSLYGIGGYYETTGLSTYSDKKLIITGEIDPIYFELIKEEFT